MYLKINRTPYWTEEHIEFYSDNYICFEDDLNKEELEDLLEKVRAGNKISRCPGRCCYEIFECSSYVGDLTIDEAQEMDIAIMEQYKGKGYATNAIKLFISEYKPDLIEAVVREQNPNKKKIIHILEENGFRKCELCYRWQPKSLD